MFIPVWLVGSAIAVLFLLAIGLWSLWDYKNELRVCVKRREQDVDIISGRLGNAWEDRRSTGNALKAAQDEIAQMKDELTALADSWSRNPSDQ